MISGALLLNREIELVSFIKKKWIRLTYPFIFYLAIHFIIHLIFDIDLFNIFGYNWYFWMILCVFLVIPIINKFILNSSMHELEYFVLMIFISSIIYQVLNFIPVENFIDLSFFMGPLSYIILGYYFSIKEFKISANKLISICLLLFTVSTIMKMSGAMNFIPIELTKNVAVTRTDVFTSYVDVGVFQIIQVSSLFLLIKNLYSSDSGFYFKFKKFLEIDTINKFIISVSKASYGMYLINRTLMLYCDFYVKPLTLTGKQILASFIILTFSIFFISWIVVVILSKIPFLSKFSGYS